MNAQPQAVQVVRSQPGAQPTIIRRPMVVQGQAQAPGSMNMANLPAMLQGMSGGQMKVNQDSTKNVTANIQGWEKDPCSGDVNRVNMQKNQGERVHDCPVHGKVYAVMGNEGADLSRTNSCG